MLTLVKRCPYFRAHISLGARPKTNPSVDYFQYRMREAIYVPDDVWELD